MRAIPDIVVSPSLVKPSITPTNHYPTVIIQYCGIVFISQVLKSHRLSDFPKLYISHTKPTPVSYTHLTLPTITE